MVDLTRRAASYAQIHLDRLEHNIRLLQTLVGNRPLWPAIKANAYGHGAVAVARHLLALGYDTLCVAHAEEAAELVAAGVDARFLILSPALPEQSDALLAHRMEPVVCTVDALAALQRAATRAGKRLAVHVKVDTGMGRVGIRPEAVPEFLERCRQHPALQVRGLMSHFPRADEADKGYSEAQLAVFEGVCRDASRFAIEFRHMANSAAIFDLPKSHLDAVRPGIAIYGLAPSAAIGNPRVRELQPVLEWRTRITFLKETPSGTGLSYGHTFRTERPSLVATIPVGYGDGLRRNLSNRLEVLVAGQRCRQVGTITMDQSLVDVTPLRGRVAVGDDVVLIGRQDGERVGAEEWADRLGTIHYEVVTGIAKRVARVTVAGTDAPYTV